MGDRLRFLLNRIGERLWVKPLAMCVLSIAGAFVAKAADDTGVGEFVPEISPDSIETLLTILSSSMLVIATFAVSSMVSAYASASSTATPRAFSLVVSDDVSQNALSTFIGAFIFGIVALIALLNSYYDKAGRFALFALTLLVFVIVILTFVRWVDRIARLGRLGATIAKVEAATAASLKRRRLAPTLRGVAAGPRRDGGRAVDAVSIGYVQRVEVAALQRVAAGAGVRIRVEALPGTFCAPGRPVAVVTADSGDFKDVDPGRIAEAFLIGEERLFDDDPRFGLITLSEISSRALSPAVNDPGTAIAILGTFVRLFALWREPVEDGDAETADCDRVEVPEISVRDLFDDAFSATARDGAGIREVVVRLLKSLDFLASSGDAGMRDAAILHARMALARAENAMDLPEDLEVVRGLAEFSTSS